jgi:hypothetical protein
MPMPRPSSTSEFFPPLFRPLSSLATVTIAILRDKVITVRPEPDADWGLQRTTCQQSTLNQAVVGTPNRLLERTTQRGNQHNVA